MRALARERFKRDENANSQNSFQDQHERLHCLFFLHGQYPQSG